MRDSLDLDALKQQIARMTAQAERDRRWTGYMTRAIIVMLIVSVVILGLNVFISLGSVSFFYALAGLMALLLLTFTAFLSFITWRNIRGYSQRVKHFAPAFVHRPNLRDMLWEMRTYIWLWAVLFGCIILIDQFLNIPWVATLLYIAPYLASYIIQRTYIWIYFGGLPRVNAALKLFPYSHKLLLARANFILNNHDTDGAIVILTRLLTSRTDYANPNVVLELLLYSEALAHQERFNEAVQLFEAAIQIQPTAAIAYGSLAETYLNQDIEYERAVALLDIALPLTNPKEIYAYPAEHAVYAHALAKTNHVLRAKASIGIAEAAIDKLPPANASACYRHLGQAYLALGDVDTAHLRLNRAIELDRDGVSGKLAQRVLEKLSQPTV